MPRVDNPLSPIVAKIEGLHLFHFDMAPCAQRVRFALAEKGLIRGREVRFDADDKEACRGEAGAWTSRIVSLKTKEHLSEAYAKIQPNLVVPALVHDGVLYTESMDIIAYLDETFGGEPLIPTDDAERLREIHKMTDLGKSLHRSIRFVTFRWGLGRFGKLNSEKEAQLKALVQKGNDGEKLVEFYERFNQNEIEDSIYQEHLDALAEGFALLEAKLEDGRSFITGSTLTMADVIWAMKILRLDECGYPFKKHYPAVYNWFGRIRDRPAFKTGVMENHQWMNRAFRIKARVENLLGIGLENAVTRGVHA